MSDDPRVELPPPEPPEPTGAADVPEKRILGLSPQALIGVAIAMIVGLVAIVGVMQATGDDLEPIATETCDELDGAIVLQAGGILERAIDRAADAGYSAPELGDRMRDECPGIMAAIENIGEEQEARDRLPDEVDLDLGNCGSDEVTGTVTNNSDLTVDIFVDIVFFDIADQQVGDSIAIARNVDPGVTARWSASVFESYDRCRATVGSVFES